MAVYCEVCEYEAVASAFSLICLPGLPADKRCPCLSNTFPENEIAHTNTVLVLKYIFQG